MRPGHLLPSAHFLPFIALLSQTSMTCGYHTHSQLHMHRNACAGSVGPVLQTTDV